MVACGGWSGGVWGLEWWQVGVGVVAGGGSSGGMRQLEWWHIIYLIIRRYSTLLKVDGIILNLYLNLDLQPSCNLDL